MQIHKSDFLSQRKRDLGFVGAIVCEFANPNDTTMIAKLWKAFDWRGPACIKGQWFIVASIDIEASVSFGTITFGLAPGWVPSQPA